MTDEPRFLRSDAEPAPADSDSERRALLEKVQAVREQREALEAQLAQRLDELAPPDRRAVLEAAFAPRSNEPVQRACIGCQSPASAPLYVLTNYGSVEIARRYALFGTTLIQSTTVAPSVLPMCARCYAPIVANRARHGIGAVVAAVGLLAGMGYFVAALAKAPTPVALGLLFGGGAITALAMVHAVFNLRALHKLLKLPKLPGLNVRVVSRKREDLDRALDRLQLNSLEIQNELDRNASDAAKLPAARIRPK